MFMKPEVTYLGQGIHKDRICLLLEKVDFDKKCFTSAKCFLIKVIPRIDQLLPSSFAKFFFFIRTFT